MAFLTDPFIVATEQSPLIDCTDATEEISDEVSDITSSSKACFSLVSTSSNGGGGSGLLRFSNLQKGRDFFFSFRI